MKSGPIKTRQWSNPGENYWACALGSPVPRLLIYVRESHGYACFHYTPQPGEATALLTGIVERGYGLWALADYLEEHNLPERIYPPERRQRLYEVLRMIERPT